MEPLATEPRQLNLCDGWEQQVNRRAAQKAARRQANRILTLFCIAMLMIIAGGICLGYAGELPMGISVAVEISGAALLFFTLGLLAGRRQRR